MVYEIPQVLTLVTTSKIARNCKFAAASTAALLCCLAVFSNAGPLAANPLGEELQHLLDTNPRLKAAQKGISASEQGIREARAGYYPTVNLSGDIGREYVDSPARRTTEGEDFFDTRRATTLTVTQNLFKGFRTTASEKIAEIEKEVSSVRYRITEQSVLFDGIRAYLNVLKQSRLLEIAKQNENTLQEQLELESARVDRGSGLAVDVLQAKSRLQLARERVVSILGDLRNAHSVYLELFNRPAVPARMTVPVAPVDDLPNSQEGAISIAEQENPVLRQSINVVDIASERRTVEQSTFWPRIDLVGEGSWEKNVDGVPGVRREGQVTVRAVWDIFDGFLTPARSSRAAVDYSAALDGRRTVDRDVRNRVRQAWSRYRTTGEQRELLENAVNIAAEVFEARRKLRQRGRESVINLLDAENELNSARLRLTDSSFNHVTAAYRVLLQTGRLTPESLKLAK